MTPEQINIAITEAQGFRERGGGPFGIYYDKEDDNRYWVSPEYIEGFKPPWTDFDGTAYYSLPDYCNDLNAMHEAWCSLTLWEHQEFRHELQAVIAYAQEDEEPHKGPCHSVCNATALQRAEAYLRTIGKWDETNNC